MLGFAGGWVTWRHQVPAEIRAGGRPRDCDVCIKYSTYHPQQQTRAGEPAARWEGQGGAGPVRSRRKAAGR